MDIKVETNMTEWVEAWAKARESIAPDAQERVAKLLEDGVTTRAGLSKKLDAIMAEMIRGNISPPVFAMLKQMLELQANNIYVMHEEQDTKHLIGQDLSLSVTHLLANARKSEMYLIDAREARRDPDLIDADPEPEPVDAETE